MEKQNYLVWSAMSNVFNNGRQFDTDKLRDYLLQYGHHAKFTVVTNLQTNEQVEVPNKVIFHGLQKKLNEAKQRWVDELPSILWSICTTGAAMGETPFMLVYRSKPIPLVKVGVHTY